MLEDVNDPVDVHLAQPVLRAILHEAPARVDHEDAPPRARVLFVDDHDASKGRPWPIWELGQEPGKADPHQRASISMMQPFSPVTASRKRRRVGESGRDSPLTVGPAQTSTGPDDRRGGNGSHRAGGYPPSPEGAKASPRPFLRRTRAKAPNVHRFSDDDQPRSPPKEH
jgi:hypothetical protein